MKKILVLAYQLSPFRGSEYSVGWNYVTNMSLDNELTVLYGASGDHMGDTDEMEEYIKSEKQIKNIDFIAVKPNKLAVFLNSLNRAGIFTYSFYFAYKVWHWQAYQVAKKITVAGKFDVVHFLTPIGYREPGLLWKLKLPYIWGPIGGLTNTPVALMDALSIIGKIKLYFRSSINTLQLHCSIRIRKAIKNTDLLLTATTENQKIIKNNYSKESIYMPENGIIGDSLFSPNLSNGVNSLTQLIWIGRIDELKSLITFLKSLRLIKNKNKVVVAIVGDGILKKSLMKYSDRYLHDVNVIWHGNVPRDKVFSLLKNAHLNVITSVKEGNPTIIWEAMSLGVPTITLDHCGMHDTICEKCGIKIPILSYTQVIDDLAYHIDRLVNSPDEIYKLSKGVIECAQKYTWEKRVAFFNKAYEIAINNRNGKNKK